MNWKKYIKYLSVSSLRAHDANPVKWAYRYLEKRKDSTPTIYHTYGMPVMTFGTNVHEMFENIISGQDVDLEWAKGLEECGEEKVHKILDLFKEKCYPSLQGKEVEVEYKFQIEVDEKLPPILGYIDVLVKEDVPTIIDHKVKSKAWYSSDKLGIDEQFLTYSWAAQKVLGVENGVNIQVNEILPKNKQKLIRVHETFVSTEEINNHVSKWMIPKICEVVDTIDTYEKGGMAGIYKTSNKCGNCIMSYGQLCCFSEECVELGIDW